MPASSMAFSSYNWIGLLKHLHQMLIADSKMEEGINWSVRVDGMYHYIKITRLLLNTNLKIDPPPTTGPYSQPRQRNIINRSLANIL
jgi:hypothetical protein